MCALKVNAKATFILISPRVKVNENMRISHRDLHCSLRCKYTLKNSSKRCNVKSISLNCSRVTRTLFVIKLLYWSYVSSASLELICLCENSLLKTLLNFKIIASLSAFSAFYLNILPLKSSFVILI